MVVTLGPHRSLNIGTPSEKKSVDGESIFILLQIISQHQNICSFDSNISLGSRLANKAPPNSRRLEEFRALAGCFYATYM